MNEGIQVWYLYMQLDCQVKWKLAIATHVEAYHIQAAVLVLQLSVWSIRLSSSSIFDKSVSESPFLQC